MGTAILVVFIIWLVFGLIALALGYLFLEPEEKKKRFWKNILIVALGYIAILGVIGDIQDEVTQNSE